MALSDSDSDARSDLRSDSSDSDVASDAQPPRVLLSNPNPSYKLSTNRYNSLDDLLDDLHKYGAAAGFSVCKIRANNYVKDFRPTRIDLGCTKGKIRPS